MRILSIDTSTKMLCLALSDNGKIIFNYRRDAGVKHSAILFSTLESLLKKYGIKKETIGTFAVGLGPGSFTGLRISLSAVKGLLLASKKKVVGIPTLDIIAKNTAQDGLFWVISDANRGNIYAASYERKNERLKRLTSYTLINFNAWLKGIKNKVFVLGGAVGIYGAELAKNKNISCLAEKFWWPDAKNLCVLAIEKLSSQGPDKIGRLLPLYLYPKECQIKTVTRNP